MDNENIQLLRLRSFTLGTPLPDSELLGPNVQERVAALIGIMEPFVSYSTSLLLCSRPSFGFVFPLRLPTSARLLRLSDPRKGPLSAFSSLPCLPSQPLQRCDIFPYPPSNQCCKMGGQESDQLLL